MKSSFSLKYTVLNGGWATLEIGHMEKTVTLNISFFRDSLKELAKSAIVQWPYLLPSIYAALNRLLDFR